MSKKQKKNPNKIPATPEMAAREADRAYYCAIANVIDSIAETEKYTFEEIGSFGIKSTIPLIKSQAVR